MDGFAADVTTRLYARPRRQIELYPNNLYRIISLKFGLFHAVFSADCDVAGWSSKTNWKTRPVSTDPTFLHFFFFHFFCRDFTGMSLDYDCALGRDGESRFFFQRGGSVRSAPFCGIINIIEGSTFALAWSGARGRERRVSPRRTQSLVLFAWGRSTPGISLSWFLWPSPDPGKIEMDEKMGFFQLFESF